MRGSELLDKMELVDPTYIEAADAKPKRRKTAWGKWGALAACICIMLATAIAIPEIFRYQNSNEPIIQGDEISNIVPDIPAGENDWLYNDRLYVIGSIYDKGNMEDYGLPWPIDESSIGDQCGYVYRWDNYETEYTKVPVFDYLPLNVEAVKITTDQAGDYCYITFVAYRESDDNDNVKLLDHLSEFYGLVDAEDIAEVIIDTGYTDSGVISKIIDNSSSIESFFNAIVDLEGEWYSVINAPDGTVYHVKIRLKNGLQAGLFYYADSNCFGSGNVLYQFDEATGKNLKELFELNY